MGSLAARPKAPKLSKPPVTAPVVPAVPVALAPASPPPTAAPLPEPQPAARPSLLERGRGMFGTVLTGFRGLLNQAKTASRKTLLGE